MDKKNEAKSEGLVNDIKGKIKDAAGGLTDDAHMQAQGKVDQLTGAAQQEFADLYDEAETTMEKMAAFVQDRPVISVAVAAIVGAIFGSMFLRCPWRD